MKRKSLTAFVVFIVLAAALTGVLSGCNLFDGGGSFSVTIDAAGGILNSKESYETTAGGNFNLSKLPVPTREGYSFVAWMVGEKQYGREAVLKITEDITLTAIWKRESGVFLLTFEKGVEGAAPQVLSVKDGEAFLLSKAAVPVREGFEFLGWRDGDTLYLLDDDNEIYPADDMVFIAEWRASEYTVVFKNGDAVLSSAAYGYGELPTVPAFDPVRFPEQANVSETETMVFKGWDKTIEKVSADAVYTALYETRVRTYELNVGSKGIRFSDKDGNPIEKIQGAYNVYFEFYLTVLPGVRLDGGMTVRLNGEILTPNEAGAYSATLNRDGLEITVDNLEYVQYDAVFQTGDAYYEALNGSNFGIEYGGSFEFAAWGAAGYDREQPRVYFNLISDGLIYEPAPYKVEDGKYYYRIENVTETITVKIYGNYNVARITYVDINGNTLDVGYEVGNYKKIGDKAHFENTSFPVVTEEGVTYRGWGDDGSSAPYYYAVTKSADQADRLKTKAEYDDWVAALKVDSNHYVPPELSLDEPNVLYLIYYQEERKFDMSLVVSGYTVEASFNAGETWETFSEGRSQTVYAEGIVPVIGTEYYFWATYRTEVQIRLSGGTTGGTLPNLIAGEQRTIAPDPGGVYRITSIENARFVSDQETVTAKLPKKSELFYFEDRDGEEFLTETVAVQKGSDFQFIVRYVKKMSDANRRYDELTNNISVNGQPPTVSKESNNSSFAYLYCIVEDVAENLAIEVTAPVKAPYLLRFPKVADVDTYVDGVKIEFAEEATYADVWVDLTKDCYYALVPKAGYEFASRPSFSFYYHKSTFKTSADIAVNKSAKKYSLSTVEKNTGLPNAFGYNLSNIGSSYSFFVEANSTIATDKQKLWTVTDAALTPETVAAEEFTLRSNPTDTMTGVGALYTTPPAKKAPKQGTFTVSITVPAGMVPMMYLEWADAVTDGFRAISHASKSGSTYTFDVVNARENFRWYILLTTESYDVTFRWGDESLTLKLPHGTPITSIALPERFNGVKDGVDGVFTVLKWMHADGSRFLTVTGAEDVTAETKFAPAAASFNGIYYATVAEALNALTGTSTGNLDILTGATGAFAETLAGGTAASPVTYTIPAGVTLRLPFRQGGYGFTLAKKEDNPSVLFASADHAVTGLNVPAGVVLNVYGTVDVGALIGYPESAYPYQGQVSGAYAVLHLDGKINVEAGGKVYAYGYIEGSGSIEVKGGGEVGGSFVVRDYRGGTNSSGVYNEGVAPFNVYELPNLLVPVTLLSGAKETAKATLYALYQYNTMELDVLGGEGLIKHAEGGKIVKTTRRVKNDRYNDNTKQIEPEYEYRTRIDVYGGGKDGVLSLDGIVKTTGIAMAINFIYDIHLWDGDYEQNNYYKLMPGGALTVEQGASLALKMGTNAMGTLTTYTADFKDNFGTQGYTHKNLLYPVIAKAGRLVVNGTLSVYGKLGAYIETEAAGAEIYIYSPLTFLFVDQIEGVAFSGNKFEVTYRKKEIASIQTASGILNIPSGGYYVSKKADNGSFLWEKA